MPPLQRRSNRVTDDLHGLARHGVLWRGMAWRAKVWHAGCRRRRRDRVPRRHDHLIVKLTISSWHGVLRRGARAVVVAIVPLVVAVIVAIAANVRADRVTLDLSSALHGMAC